MCTRALIVCLTITYISLITPPAETFRIDLDDIVNAVPKVHFKKLSFLFDLYEDHLPKLANGDLPNGKQIFQALNEPEKIFVNITSSAEKPKSTDSPENILNSTNLPEEIVQNTNSAGDGLTPVGLINYLPDFPRLKSGRCPPGEDLLDDGTCLPPME